MGPSASSALACPGPALGDCGVARCNGPTAGFNAVTLWNHARWFRTKSRVIAERGRNEAVTNMSASKAGMMGTGMMGMNASKAFTTVATGPVCVLVFW